MIHGNKSKATGLQLVFRVLWALSAKVISAFGTLLLTYTVSRYLGLSSLGSFSTAAAAMLGVVVVSNFGSSTFINKTGGIYLGKKDPGAARLIYLNSVKMSVAASMTFSVLGVLFLMRTSGPAIQIWLLMSAPGVAVLMLNAALFRANLDPSWAPFCEFGFLSLLSSICILGIVYLGDGLASLEIIGAVIFCITYSVLGVSLFVIHKRIARFWSAETKIVAPARRHLGQTKNFFMMEFAQYFSQWGLIIVIGFFVTIDEVGIFAAVLKLAFLVNFILGVTSNTVSAQIASLYAAEEFETMARVRRDARYTMLSIAVPMALLLFVFKNEILGQFKIMGDLAPTIFGILLGFQVLNVLTGMSPIVLKMVGFERIMRNIVVFTLIAQLVLTVVLTWYFGLLGATFAFSITLITKNVAANFYERRLLPQIP